MNEYPNKFSIKNSKIFWQIIISALIYLNIRIFVLHCLDYKAIFTIFGIFLKAFWTNMAMLDYFEQFKKNQGTNEYLKIFVTIDGQINI